MDPDICQATSPERLKLERAEFIAEWGIVGLLRRDKKKTGRLKHLCLITQQSHITYKHKWFTFIKEKWKYVWRWQGNKSLSTLWMKDQEAWSTPEFQHRTDRFTRGSQRRRSGLVWFGLGGFEKKSAVTSTNVNLNATKWWPQLWTTNGSPQHIMIIMTSEDSLISSVKTVTVKQDLTWKNILFNILNVTFKSSNQQTK